MSDASVHTPPAELPQLEATLMSPLAEGTDRPPSRYVRLGDLVLEHRLWRNPRTLTGLDDASLAELAASVRAQTVMPMDQEDSAYVGIRDPLTVVQVSENGGMVNLVLDGQRRYMAACQVMGVLLDSDKEVDLSGWDALVPVIDVSPEPVTLTPELANHYLMIALDTVGTRAGLSSYELSESAERLRESKNEATGKEFTLAEIAGAVHRSESWVSKILKARSTATPKLKAMWRRGEVTDEQFKELAAQKDPERQKETAAEVADARKQGDKATARTLAKEEREVARATEPAKPSAKSNGVHAAPKKLAKGDQVEIPIPPTRKPPSFAVIEDILGMAAKHPPTADYVKGFMDGLRYDRGLMDSNNLAKPWQAYLQHATGQKPDKPARKPKPVKRVPLVKAAGRARRAKK